MELPPSVQAIAYQPHPHLVCAASPTAARAGGKPPLHPSALKGQRRISFGMGEEPRVNRPNGGDTPLDKMLVQVCVVVCCCCCTCCGYSCTSSRLLCPACSAALLQCLPGSCPASSAHTSLPAARLQLAGSGRGLGSLPEEAADMEADAAAGPGGEEQEEEQWGGQVADRPLTEDELRLGRTFTEEERRVWEALPETAKRLSLDGIMSFDAHMVRQGCAGWGKSVWVGRGVG